MTDKIQQILVDFLAEGLSEQDFRRKAAEYVGEKPWRHRQVKLGYTCSKCGRKECFIYWTDKPRKNKGYCPIPDPLDGPLEVWAFRLRDEVIDDKGCKNWEEATAAVYQYSKTEEDTIWDWWMDLAQPKHFIVAAIIAKELAKGKNDQRQSK